MDRPPSQPARRALLGAALLTWSVAWAGCAWPGAENARADELVGAPERADAAQAEGAEASSPERRKGALWYRMSMEGASLRVRLRLLAPPERVSFFLPGPWAGRRDHHAAITLRRARTPDGERAFALEAAERRVDVDVGRAPWVELTYDVALADRDSASQRFSPQRVASGYFAYATTLLVLPSARVCDMLADIPIEVRVPHTFSVASNWPRVHEARSRTNPEEHVFGFLAPDVASLRDAFVTAHDELEVDEGDAATVVYERGYDGDRAALSGAIRRIVAHYSRGFGPQRSVTALVRTPHARGRRTLWGTGRREGFVLELDRRAPVDTHTMLLIAHEAFHLWNGHMLTPAPDADAQTLWFKEGVTQYVALNTLARLGVLSEREVLDEWARAAARYARAQRAHALAPVAREQLPYDRGLLIALALEAAWRQDPDSEATLDAWVQLMLEASAASRYAEDDLRAGLEELSPPGAPARAVWARHVTRGEPIDPGALFTALGLHYLPPTPEREPRLIPLEDRRALFRSLLGAREQPRPAH
jgi:predicted metalloprotease with PDZ domain